MDSIADKGFARSPWDYDPKAARDGLTELNSLYAMGIVNDEQAFLELVSLYDKMLGRVNACKTTEAVINDDARWSYLYMTALMRRRTKLTMRELVKVAQSLNDAFSNKKRKPKHAKKFPFETDADLYDMMVLWSMHTDFEPEWHMRRRGDHRPLPSSKDKNLWRYLNSLYTDPEMARMVVPSFVKKLAPFYPGYENCVRKAIADGKEELRRLYGPDVDLTPLTERRKENEDDYRGIDFIRLLEATSQEQD